jgi:hypothetical protein
MLYALFIVPGVPAGDMIDWGPDRFCSALPAENAFALDKQPGRAHSPDVRIPNPTCGYNGEQNRLGRGQNQEHLFAGGGGFWPLL